MIVQLGVVTVAPSGAGDRLLTIFLGRPPQAECYCRFATLQECFYLMIASKLPASTWVPGGVWMVSTIPSSDALIVVSIFIASSTNNF